MILITGASSGLGAALAKQYIAEGEAVCITGRNKQKLEQISNSLRPDCQSVAADLCDELQVMQLLEQLNSTPKLIVHCAGSGYFGALEQQDSLNIAALYQNNIFNTTLLLKHIVKKYQHNAVNVAVVMSTAAQQAKAGESTYCAAKWAVKGLVESLRLELKSSPLKLITVYPGGMDTDFWKTSGKQMDTTSFMSADDVATMMRKALTSCDNGFVSDITINRN